MRNLRTSLLIPVIVSILFSFLGFRFVSNKGASTESGLFEVPGTSNISASSFTRSRNNLIAGAWEGGVYLSSDDGMSWKIVAYVPCVVSAPPALFVLIPSVAVFADSDTVFAGAGQALQGGLLVSINRGETWIDPDTSFTPNIGAFAAFGDSTFAATDGGIYLSTDRGKSWNPLKHGPSSGVTGLVVYGNDLYDAAGGVFRSTDHGNTWTDIDTNLANYDLTGFGVVGGKMFIGIFPFANDPPGGIYESTDDGSDWEVADSGLTSHRVNTLISSGSYLFAGTNSGVFASTNQGETWSDLSVGTSLDSCATIALGVYNGYLFIGTNGGGIWRYPVSQLTTGVRPGQQAIPSDFELFQNYPNPFNPTTEIRFSVPGSESVTLQVYDILGQLVKTLVNKVEQPGSYEVQFNGSGLASGVYFYRLTAGSYSKTMRLMLLK